LARSSSRTIAISLGRDGRHQSLERADRAAFTRFPARRRSRRPPNHQERRADLQVGFDEAVPYL